MNLPLPDADAAVHSDALVRVVKAELDAQGGWMSFSRYMELALYAPGLGYYAAGARKFGAAGDFVTAPELSPLFSVALAAQVEQIMAHSAPVVIEAGPGSGVLAAGLLRELDRRGALPERYLMLEVSAELRARQRETLARAVPHLAQRVQWLEALPDRHEGAVIANELLDALPLHRVFWSDAGISERGVCLDAEERFSWSDRPAQGALRDAAERIAVPTPYLSEIGLAARAWIATWAERLQRGAMLLLDYGFPAAEFYHPQRGAGTLMCHYRHHAHDDPFHLPGLTDITAHVDFSAIAEAGVEGGLELCGYTSQGQFLLNCGIAQALAQAAPEGSVDYLRLAAGVKKLLSPAEMGELFKVMALGREMPAPLLGFAGGDRSHRL